MRKFLIPLMLASVALPAAAIAGDEDRDARRAARAEQRADRPERADRAERASPQQPQQQTQQQPQQQAQQQEAPRQEAPRQMRMERTDRSPDQAQQQQYTDRQSRQADRQVERQQRIEQQQQRIDQQQGGFARPDRAQRNGWVSPNGIPSARQPEVDREQRNRGPRVISTDGLPQENGALGQRNRADRGDIVRQDRPARGSFAERLDRQQERNLAHRVRGPGLPPGTVTGVDPRSGGNVGGGGLISTPLPGGGELRHSGSGSQWGTQWRDDNRYDWQNWRRRHHSSFHIGFYSDPFGFGYQRMGYGWQLFPSYYQSSYWLRDPWQYRLPPVYGPYRWVRYYDDALLVDTWSGEVVDVIYDFFW